DELVQQVISELEPETRERHVDWRLEHLPFVSADRGLMHQVLANLLANAVKYTRPRDPAEVRVFAIEQDDEIIFGVADNGVGFNMEYIDKLFGVFQRLHTASEFEGTGVGLANVRRIVQRHGGRTWAEGVQGHGATFYFSLAAPDALECKLGAPGGRYVTS